MSVFTSAIKSGNTENLAQLISELESSLPARYYSFVDSSAASIATTTPTTRLNQTVTMSADEIAVFITSCDVSCGTTGEVIGLQHYIGGGVDSNSTLYYTESSGTTNGYRTAVTNISINQNLSGSTDFTLKWSRNSGSGTLYSLRANGILVILKKRS